MHWAPPSGVRLALPLTGAPSVWQRTVGFVALLFVAWIGLPGSANAQCPGIPIDGCCNGDVYRSCSGTTPTNQDCSAFGQACGEPNGSGFVGCFDPFLIGPVDHSCQACTPDCTGKTCGDDGCGGSCGDCGANSTCNATGQCQALPNCNQVAGECCIGDLLVLCYAEAPEVEDCADQGLVCGASVGDGFVGCNQSFSNIPGISECPAGCTPQCDGKVCGDDGCGGECGTCTGAGEFCNADQTACTTCTPQCDGRVCGFDTCGGSCGECAGAGEVCNADGQCEIPERTCPNIPAGGCCEGGIYKTCDDGPHTEIRCSDFDAQCGASWTSGMAGCWPDSQYSGPSECGCIPQCDGKNCGDDGCGGVCGTCGLGAECTFEGQCEYTGCPDVPNRRCCTGEVLTDCSPNGSVQIDCAGRNQYCGWSNVQNLYSCVDEPNVVDGTGVAPRNCPDAPVCTPSCDGRTCGSDGCGGSCGTCADGVACDFRSGSCVEETVCSDPSMEPGGCCVGTKLLSCSSDTDHPTLIECPTIRMGNFDVKQACGYSNSSGRLECIHPSVARTQNENPNQSMQCPANLCIPQCFEGDNCGPDGCGGVCGVCSDGLVCSLDDDGAGGKCEAPCSPSCAGRTCGDNGCGGSCGTCDSSAACQEYDNGQSSCVNANRCGDLDEGEACCGSRGRLQQCNRGQLEVNYCGSQQYCGWNADSDGYTCGVLNEATDPSGDQPRFCTDYTCVPNCSNRTCGSDGCGGSCGTCADGEECNIHNSPYRAFCEAGTTSAFQRSSLVVPPSGCCTDAAGLPLRYPVSDPPAAAYALSTTYSSYTAQLAATPCTQGCGFDVERQKYRCNASGETLPAIDPTGAYDGTCPAPTCTPFCGSNQCGDDGCGGSCGTCSGTQECYSGACASPCAAERDQTDQPFINRGRCHGSYLSYCENGLPYEEDCSLTPGFCGFNAALNVNTCGTSGVRDTLALSSSPTDCTWAAGTCGYNRYCLNKSQQCPFGQECSVSTTRFDVVGATLVERNDTIVGTCSQTPVIPNNTCSGFCGRERNSCSCSDTCEDDGDCCPDYGYQCTNEAPVANCGDDFCFYEAGEDCASCQADCGTCDYTEVTPPWKAPFPLVEAAFSNGIRQVSAAHPLDDILPPSAPFTHDGLMKHLARPQLNLGPQGSLGLWDLDTTTTAAFPQVVPGAVGDGMRFWQKTNDVYSNGVGDFHWTPDGYLPRLKEGAEPGGLSVAMWVKVPTDLGTTAVNTLWNAEAAFSNTTWDAMRKCVAPRRGAAQVTITCNAQGQTIKDVVVYAGEIDGLRQPGGTCQTLDDVGVEGGCRAEGATASALTNCIGQTSCTLSVPSTIEGCERDTPPTVYAEALCAWSEPTPSKGLSFLIQPKTRGHTLSLNSVASSLTSDVGLTPGQWHHVAFAFQPLTTPFQHTDKTAGIARLYVDGALVGINDGFKMDRLRRARMQPPTSQVALDAETLQAAGTQVGLFSDVDEVMVYDRSLSGRELSRMVRAARQKLLRVWPEVGAANVARNHPGVTTVSVEAPHLVAVGRRDASQTVRREDQAIRVPAGQTLTLTEKAHHGLTDLNTYTAMAWVRKSAASTTSSLMALGDTATNSALTLDLDDTCGGRGVTATFGGSVSLAQTGCQHGVDPGQWAFVAVTQSATLRKVYVDGVEVARATLTSSTPLFAAAGIPQVSFTDVDVYWSALFKKALPQEDLSLWFRSGPVLWTNGGTYSPASASKQLVRDYAMFAERGTTVQTPTVWENGAAIISGNAAGPLVLVKSSDQHLTVPANAFFPRLPGTEAATSGPRQFSVITRQAVAPGGPYPVVDLVDTVAGQHVTVFRADIYCDSSNTCLIRGRARAAGPDVTASKDEVSFVTASFDAGEAGSGAQLSVGLSFDGRHVSASLGGLADTTDGATLDPAERLAVTETLESRALPSDTASPASLTGSFFRLSAKRSSTQQVAVSEFRLYARSMSSAELAVLNSRDCENAGCDARGLTCHVGAPEALPTCMGCADNQTALSSSSDASCTPQRVFNDVCSFNQQCTSGNCFAGFCVEDDRGLCDETCDALGRNCTTLFDSNSQYQCTWSCKQYFTTETGSAYPSYSAEACYWSPTTEDGNLCSANDQCRSGACIQQATSVYKSTAYETCPTQPPSNAYECRQPADNPNYWQVVVRNQANTANETINAVCVRTTQPNDPLTALGIYDQQECPPVFTEQRAQTETLGLCAESDSIGCLAKNRQSGAHRVNVQGEDTSVFTCSQCLDTTFNGKPLYVKGWRMMRPSLCRSVKDAYVESTIHYQEKRQIFSFAGNVGADYLKKLLLRKTGAITPAEYSQFEKMGFGTTVLNYSIWPQSKKDEWRSKWGKELDFEDCSVEPGASTAGNPFFDPVENAEVCVPNKFPNGTPCPPPGYNPTSGDSPHSFCESGFCARDTGLCEEGYGTLEDNQGENRADKKNGNGDSTGLVQKNTSSLQVRQVGTLENGQTKKRRYTLSTVNDNQLTFFGKTQSILRMEQTMTTSPDDEETTFTGKNFLFGFQIPSSEPATRCPGQSFEDGEWSGGEEECDRIKEVGQLKPALPTPKICLPSPWSCPEDYAAQLSNKGPMCVRKVFFAGPVPITVQAEVILDICLGVGAEVDDETQEPSMAIKPAVGVVVEVRGGVGGAVGPVELFAGVRAAITVVGLEFPISWSTAIEERIEDKDGENIENLYVVKFQRKAGMDITILKLAFGVFAEAGVGWFAVEWEHLIFEFAGITLKFELASEEIQSKKVDFDHPTAAFAPTQ